ncbi:uncharacterized protein LOC123004699 isoform X2 [Tribolium madens]|uniref:uncharacterized protein LOC123004699 isoform X2 n=1 Tax=Tribolium madens TaxID=41895 RepID=UPI001CF760E7|nr:uncharacterized protein LOC123004699 isoform X2 [Tribolium madens]
MQCTQIGHLKLFVYFFLFVMSSWNSIKIVLELLLLESDYQNQKTYKFEDFFWTGSGDGSDDEYPWTDKPTTIYKTKTVLSTIYLEPSTMINTTTKCSFNCETPVTTTEEITPTPTQPPDDDFLNADRHFWLLTVLKSDGKDPVIIDLKNSLAKLYKTAFQRQQERHLGIVNRDKRDAKSLDKPVKVYIHNVEKSKINGDEKIEVLYHVSVSGKPVDAVTAAADMTLITDDEVRNELGYPFLIKAEPYLKPPAPQGLSRSKNTWIFIGVSIVALLAILLVVAFLTLALTKRKKRPSSGMENRRQIFERGAINEPKPDQSPTYINFRNQPSNQTLRSVSATRPRSSISSSSASSTSLDISPLMALKKQRTPPKPPRPKAATNLKRIAPELLDSDSNGSKRESPETIYDPGVVSPKSYLSMPSVKAFPRGCMPEPLNKVLEPVSVLHLDMPDDDGLLRGERTDSRYGLRRHGSFGAMEDPGVIGPVVWNMHCQRLQHGVSVDEGIDDLKVPSNVSRMRKRFHDLLDDTFSLFGSRRESPSKPPPIEVKSHSAVNRPNDDTQPTVRPRPKTTDPRRMLPSPGSTKPKGAWASTAPSPLIRPLSADITPKINVEHILAEGKFRANDPAVPLIAAIKSEIEKCSLPGSTTDVRK